MRSSKVWVGFSPCPNDRSPARASLEQQREISRLEGTRQIFFCPHCGERRIKNPPAVNQTLKGPRCFCAGCPLSGHCYRLAVA